MRSSATESSVAISLEASLAVISIVLPGELIDVAADYVKHQLLSNGDEFQALPDEDEAKKNNMSEKYYAQESEINFIKSEILRIAAAKARNEKLDPNNKDRLERIAKAEDRIVEKLEELVIQGIAYSDLKDRLFQINQDANNLTDLLLDRILLGPNCHINFQKFRIGYYTIGIPALVERIFGMKADSQLFTQKTVNPRVIQTSIGNSLFSILLSMHSKQQSLEEAYQLIPIGFACQLRERVEKELSHRATFSTPAI